MHETGIENQTGQQEKGKHQNRCFWAWCEIPGLKNIYEKVMH
jgi:hypothetical protein